VGVKRYTLEILNRLEDKIDTIEPYKRKRTVWGHLWEQCYLPLKLKGRLLFSPSNTGPLSVRRQVVTIHDVATLDHPEAFNPRFAAWYRFLIPRLANRVRRVITISEFTKQRLLAYVPVEEERVVVIYNGVDQRFRPHTPESITQVRKPLGLPGKRYVLSVGTLEPRKNIPRLIQAWARIVDKLPDDIWLVLAGQEGRGDLYARLSGLNMLPPRVHLTGYVPDELLPALYAGAMVFVFPSLYEGFGLPPLEAMASGVPVLTGNRTSLPEIVGDAGMMVDPTSVDQIAEGLLSLIQDETLRLELRRKGLDRAAQFSWDKTAQKTWEVLKEAASE